MGRDVLARIWSGFSLPAWTLEQRADSLTVATGSCCVTVHQPLWLEWSYRHDDGEWLPAGQ